MGFSHFFMGTNPTCLFLSHSRSVSDPYLSNPDLAKNLNPDPDPERP